MQKSEANRLAVGNRMTLQYTSAQAVSTLVFGVTVFLLVRA